MPESVVGSALVELGLSPDKYNKNIDDARDRAFKVAQQIEDRFKRIQVGKFDVDETNFRRDLNRVDRSKREFERDSVKIGFDTSEAERRIKDLKQQIKQLETASRKQSARSGGSTRTGRDDKIYNRGTERRRQRYQDNKQRRAIAEDNENRRSAERFGRQTGREVERGLRSALKEGVRAFKGGDVLGVILTPFRMLGSSIVKVIQGSVSYAGGRITQDVFGKGAYNLEKELGLGRNKPNADKNIKATINSDYLEREFYGSANAIAAKIEFLKQQFAEGLVVKVDDSRLYDLNKHLSQKEAHLKAVVDLFNRSEIKPFYRGSGGDGFIGGNRATVRRDLKKEQQEPVQVFQRNVQKTAATTEKKSTSLVNAALAPFKVLGKSVSKVIEGAFFTAGSGVGERVGKGIADGLELSLTDLIGSFESISEAIAGSLTDEVLIGLRDEIDLVQNLTDGLTDPRKLRVEAANIRQQKSSKEKAKEQVAVGQIEQEFGVARRNFPRIKEQKKALEKKQQFLGIKRLEVEKKIDAQLEKTGLKNLEATRDALRAEIEKAAEKIAEDADIKPEEMASITKQLEKKADRLSTLDQSIEDLKRQIRKRFTKELDAIAEFADSIDLQVRDLERQMKPFEDKELIGAQKSVRAGIKRSDESLDPRAYKEVYSQFLKLSGIDASQAVRPKLVANDNLGGATGKYDPATNELKVPSQTLQNIQAGQVSHREVDTLLHELRHGAQFGFGQKNAISGGSNIPLMRGSQDQIKRLGSSIEWSTSTGGKNAKNIRGLERDAYVFADQHARDVHTQVSRSGFEERYGVGAAKISANIEKAHVLAVEKMNKVAESVGEVGIEMSQEFQIMHQFIEKAKSKIDGSLSDAANLDEMNPEQIEELTQRIEATQKDIIGNLAQSAKMFEQKAVGKVRAKATAEAVPIQQPKEAVEQFVKAVAPTQQEVLSVFDEIKQELDQTYTSKGIKEVLKRMNYSNVSNLKKDEALELLVHSNLDEAEQIMESLGDSIKKAAHKTNTGNSLKQLSTQEVSSMLQQNQAKIKASLELLKTAKQEERSQLIDQIVVDTENEIKQIDEIRQKALTTGKDTQRLTGRRTYLEKVRNKYYSDRINQRNASIGVRATGGQRSPASLNDATDISQGLAKFSGLSDIQKRIKELTEKLSGGGSKQAVRDAETFEQVAKQAKKAEDAIDNYNSAELKIDNNLQKSLQNPVGDIYEEEENLLNRMIRVFQVKKQEFTDVFQRGVKGNQSLIFGVLAGVTQFQGVRMLIDLLGQVSSQAIAAAEEMEVLQRRTQFILGDRDRGNEAFSRIGDVARRYGFDRRSVLESSSAVLATTRGTELEGDPALQITENITKAARVKGLSTEQVQSFITQANQMIGKGRVMREDLLIMAEAMPDILQVAANAYGRNTQELNKMVASGLSATEFVKKLTDQMGAESGVGLAAAMDTNQALAGVASARVEQLTNSLGQMLLPLKKISLQALNMGLSTLNATLPVLIPLISALTIRVLTLSAVSLKNLIVQMGLLNLLSAKITLGAVLQGVAKFAMGAAAQFAVMASAGLTLIQLKNLFSDLSGEIGKQVEEAKKLNEEFDKLSNKQISPQRNDRSDFSTALERMKRGAGDFFQGKSSYKEVLDISKAIARNEDVSRQALVNLSSDATTNAINRINEIDKGLSSIQTKRRALIQANPGDKESLREFKTQERELLEQRSQADKVIASNKKQLISQSHALKEQIKALEKIKKEYPLYSNEVKDVTLKIGELKLRLEEITKAQDELNKSVGGSANLFTVMKQNITGVTTGLEDALENQGIEGSLKRAAIAQKSVSRDLKENMRESLGMEEISEQIRLQVDAYNQIKALLETEKNLEIMDARNINFNTGTSRLDSILETTDDPQEQYLIEQLKSLRERRINVAQLTASLAEARDNASSALQELSRSVAEYYQGLQRESQKQALELQGISESSQYQNQANKLKQVLSDGYSNIVTEFVESIVGLIEEQENAAGTAYRNQIALLDSQFKLQDELTKINQFERQIPVTVVPDMTEMDAQLDVASDRIKEVGLDIENEVNTNFDQSAARVEKVNQLTGDTSEKIRQVALGIGDSNTFASNLSSIFGVTDEQAKSIYESTKGTKGAIADAGEQLSKVNDWFSAILEKTKEWLVNLGRGLRDTVSKLFGLQNEVASSSSGGTVSASRKVTTPTKGPVTSRYGMRIHPVHGGRRMHTGLDIGAPMGAPIVAPVSGRITRVGTNGGYGKQVTMESIDAMGRKIEQSFAHMSSYAVRVGDIVKQGQKLGGIGSTGTSTGPHLHWEVKINGKRINPESFQKMNISIPGTSGSSSPGKVTASAPSGNLIDFIKKKESFRPNSYWDYAQHSVGYGTRAKYPGETISREEGDRRLKEEVAKARQQVLKDTKGIALASNQIDALTSLVYNAGSLTQFPKLMANLRSGNFNGAATEFLDINKAGGKVLPGLTTRRQQEAAMFLSGTGSPPMSATTAQKQSVTNTLRASEAKARDRAVKEQQIIRAQEQKELEQARMRHQREQARILRQFEQSGKQLDKERLSGRRQTTDLVAGSNLNPTPDQKFAVQSTQIQRKYEDAINERLENIKSAQERIQSAEKALATGVLTGKNAEVLQKQAAKDKVAIQEITKEVDRLRIHKKKEAEDSYKLYQKEEQLRRTRTGFEFHKNEIAALKHQLEDLQLLQQESPLDPRLKSIPQLQAKIAIEETLLDADQRQLEIQERLRKHDIDSVEFSKLKAGIDKDTIARQEQALQRRFNAEAELKRAEQERIARGQERLQQGQMEVRNLEIESLRLKGFETQARDLEQALANSSQAIEFSKSIKEIDGLARRGEITSVAASELKQNLQQINEIKLQNIKDQFNPYIEVFSSVQSSFKSFIGTVISGSSSIGSAIGNLFSSIGSKLADMASQFITNKLFSWLMGGGSTGQTPGFGGGSSGGGGLLGFATSAASILTGGGGLFGLFNKGGTVRASNNIQNFARGTSKLGQAFMRERTQSGGKKPVLAVLNDREHVLTAEQTQRFFNLGLDRFVSQPSVPNYAKGSPMRSTGQRSGGPQMNFSIPIHIESSKKGSPQLDIKKLEQVIRVEVTQQIANETRSGGLIKRQS